MVDHARPSSPFSGFDLILWSRSEGANLPVRNLFYSRFFGGDFKDGGLDDAVAELGVHDRMLADRDTLIDAWTGLVTAVPERFHARLPTVAGEMGVIYENRVLNPDLLHYQSRINAIYASGELDRLESIARKGREVRYLEIGPGAANFAVVLRDCLNGSLNAHLIDLPIVMANACAYLSSALGVESIGVVGVDAKAVETPFVLIANHLIPAYEQHLPKFDLVHNVISMNEMSAEQVEYYSLLISRVLADDGLFYLAGGHKVTPSHVDALTICRENLPNWASFLGDFGGVQVKETTNLFSTGNWVTSAAFQ